MLKENGKRFASYIETNPASCAHEGQPARSWTRSAASVSSPPPAPTGFLTSQGANVCFFPLFYIYLVFFIRQDPFPQTQKAPPPTAFCTPTCPPANSYWELYKCATPRFVRGRGGTIAVIYKTVLKPPPYIHRGNEVQPPGAPVSTMYLNF